MYTTVSVVYGLVLLLLARKLRHRKDFALFLVVVVIAGLVYGILQDLGLWDDLVRHLPT